MTAKTLRRISQTHKLSAGAEKEIKELFVHDHGPLAIADVSVHPSYQGVYAYGSFVNRRTGRKCGMFMRDILIKQGKIVVHHNGLRLNKTVNDRGWGKKWYRECELR